MSEVPAEDRWQVPARKRIRMILGESSAAHGWKRAGLDSSKASSAPRRSRPCGTRHQEHDANAGPRGSRRHEHGVSGKASGHRQHEADLAGSSKRTATTTMTRPRKVLTEHSASSEKDVGGPLADREPPWPRKSLRTNTGVSEHSVSAPEPRRSQVADIAPVSSSPSRLAVATPCLLPLRRDDSLARSDLSAVSSLGRRGAGAEGGGALGRGWTPWSFEPPPAVARSASSVSSDGSKSNGDAQFACESWEVDDDWCGKEDRAQQISPLTSEWIHPVLDLQMAFEAMLRGHNLTTPAAPEAPATPTPPAGCSCGYQRLTLPGGPDPAPCLRAGVLPPPSSTTRGASRVQDEQCSTSSLAAPPGPLLVPQAVSAAAAVPVTTEQEVGEGAIPTAVQSDPGVCSTRPKELSPLQQTTYDGVDEAFVYCDLTSRDTIRGVRAALGRQEDEEGPLVVAPLIPSVSGRTLRKAASAAAAPGCGRWCEGKPSASEGMRVTAESTVTEAPPRAASLRHATRRPATSPDADVPPPPHVAGDAEMSKLLEDSSCRTLKKPESVFLGPSGETFAQENGTEGDTERQKQSPPGDVSLRRPVLQAKTSDSATLATKGFIFMAFFLLLPLLALGALLLQIHCDQLRPMDRHREL